ncbi:hypothetical protein IWX49DRAFT_78145 [Phyllosticta citricarpa]
MPCQRLRCASSPSSLHVDLGIAHRRRRRRSSLSSTWHSDEEPRIHACLLPSLVITSIPFLSLLHPQCHQCTTDRRWQHHVIAMTSKQTSPKLSPASLLFCLSAYGRFLLPESVCPSVRPSVYTLRLAPPQPCSWGMCVQLRRCCWECPYLWLRVRPNIFDGLCMGSLYQFGAWGEGWRARKGG